MSAVIREATPADVAAILGLVRELADYERAADQVAMTEELCRDALFGPRPAASCLVAEDPAAGVVGIALWYRSFSTWTGRPGMYLEDLYVRPDHRRGGLGRALFAALAAICLAEDLPRLEWAVLTWNAPAIAFYRALGAVSMDDWATNRLTGPALAELADG